MSTKRKAENLLGICGCFYGCQIHIKRTFSVTGFYITKFRCSLEDQSINALVSLKHIFFKKKEQEDKDRIEKERLERIEFLHQPIILIKHSAKNKYICTYYTGNALERVQRVHKPADLWDITFCTR